jgi:hypothetical protein
MIYWLVLLLFILVPLVVLYWRRNLRTFLVSALPYLVYTIIDIRLECIATNNQSEACVWGYLTYIYAIVAGSIFYLCVTLVQFLIAKVRKKRSS